MHHERFSLREAMCIFLLTRDLRFGQVSKVLFGGKMYSQISAVVWSNLREYSFLQSRN